MMSSARRGIPVERDGEGAGPADRNATLGEGDAASRADQKEFSRAKVGADLNRARAR